MVSGATANSTIRSTSHPSISSTPARGSPSAHPAHNGSATMSAAPSAVPSRGSRPPLVSDTGSPGRAKGKEEPVEVNMGEDAAGRERRVSEKGGGRGRLGSSEGRSGERGKEKEEQHVGLADGAAKKNDPDAVNGSGADGTDGTEKRPKKRRRVVVACDTCRRKKVKCEGLPNPSNRCNNCAAYQYRCTFTTEQDRSRGKFEILESKVETLLVLLRSVAPDLAGQFESGQLISMPGASPSGLQSAGETEGKGSRGGDDALSPHAPGTPKGKDRATGDGGSDLHQEDQALLPDRDNGALRFYGHSCSLSGLINSLGPRARIDEETHSLPGGVTPRGGSISAPTPGGTIRHRAPNGGEWLPEDENEWIRLLRNKNLVAIGRDETLEPGRQHPPVPVHPLPPPDLLKHLFDLYFEILHPLMPIVHRLSIEEDLRKGRADTDGQFRGLVFTILALASRFSNDHRVLADPLNPTSAGDQYAAASRHYHEVFSASLINVQVLVLTSTFMHGSLGPGTAWTVLGVAIRALQDIGLHLERAYRGFSPFEQEMRRRTFWGAYILDSIFAANLGRPTALRLSDSDVRLPLPVPDENLLQNPIPVEAEPSKPNVMQGWIQLIKLNMIVEDVVLSLYDPRFRLSSSGVRDGDSNATTGKSQPAPGPKYQDMVRLNRQLDAWNEQIPKHLATGMYQMQGGILRCGYNDVKLYIHKPFLHSSPTLRKILLPFCSHHARQCLSVVIELHNAGLLSNVFFLFMQAFMSTATFMITVWHDQAAGEDLSSDIDLIHAALRVFGDLDDRFFSRVVRKGYQILQAIAARTLPPLNGSTARTPGGRTPVGDIVNGQNALPSTPTSTGIADGAGNVNANRGVNAGHDPPFSCAPPSPLTAAFPSSSSVAPTHIPSLSMRSQLHMTPASTSPMGIPATSAPACHLSGGHFDHDVSGGGGGGAAGQLSSGLDTSQHGTFTSIPAPARSPFLPGGMPAASAPGGMGPPRRPSSASAGTGQGLIGPAPSSQQRHGLLRTPSNSSATATVGATSARATNIEDAFNGFQIPDFPDSSEVFDVPNAFEDLSWQDYFARFLSDTGPGPGQPVLHTGHSPSE